MKIRENPREILLINYNNIHSNKIFGDCKIIFGGFLKLDLALEKWEKYYNMPQTF